MTKQTHYPTYNVMNEQDHWDDHTQSIVTARLIREHDYQFLTPIEAEILRSCCSLLMDDARAEIVQYILCHIDETLYQAKGEGQRKPGTPKAQVLIREGVLALDHWAQASYFKRFFHLQETEQKQMLTELSDQKAPLASQLTTITQKDFFNKILTLTVEAYYSHPMVWSEIGYGGPAYPRGYVRTEAGHLDPWEAKNNEMEI